MPERENHRRAAVKAAVVMGTLLFLLAAAYIIVQLYAILGREYKTETAISYTMADSVELPGFVMFDAVNVPGEGNLGYLAEDGERVAEGAVIAEKYTDDSQSAAREQLIRLDNSIDLLTKSQNSAGSDLTLLTTQTNTALYNLLDQLDTASYTGMMDAESEFLLAQNRLQVSTGQTSGFQSTIAELQSERDQVAAQLDGLETITAEKNGYFISAASAMPLDLEEQTLKDATPSQLQDLLNEGVADSTEALAGRIVEGFSWRFYTVCDLDTAARFDGITNVRISIPGKEDTPLDATVSSVETDEAAGLAKVVIECQTINADVLRLGQEMAQIDLKTYEGIRIDKDALHIVDGQKGVYVKYGDLQRFRKITILYEDDNYMLVPADGGIGKDSEVRLYDEIIVEGSNLQDGGLI
nr:HlyD family efflux transporter periplasmic adaptor subunit [uncultured Gemmiger sp.]